MKLLLTSAGITNKSISEAFFKLVNKKPEDTALAFIPTAANIEDGDKDWFINDLLNLKKQNLKSIDIVDISALEKDNWLPRLRKADVLFFEGGNTYHLMRWLNKSGLTELLPEMLKDKVYVGLSAGSMVTGKDLALKISQTVYGEDLDETEELKALSYVDFYFLPHLNSEWFPKVNEDEIKKVASNMKEKIYALDDDSALVVENGKVEIVSEGKYIVLN